MQHVHFQKPENALRRANELYDVGQASDALNLLYGVLNSRKFRQWAQSHEPLMRRYFDLCVELRMSQMAKEGMHQYRNITHREMPTSLEKVVNHLVYAAEAKAEAAREAAAGAGGAELTAVEDLEAGETPEDLLMSTITAEGSTERTNREVVVPWVRFLWDIYRNVLDTLRNTPNLDEFYHKICARAFRFCEKYHRPTEFHRLCAVLRNHLQSYERTLASHEAGTYKGRDAFVPWSPAVMERHTTTRFAQLQTATNMELWTEGYRTVEDIHGMMELTQKRPPVQAMATYYERLTKIFWVSKNYLFHAYAWFSFYTLSAAQNRALTAEQKQEMASAVVLAALCVPLSDGARGEDSFFDMDADRDKKMTIASLLRFNVVPSRGLLMRDIQAKGVLEAAGPQARALFDLLEVRFSPLDMVAEAVPLLENLATSEALRQYVPQLEQLVVYRLLGQLSNVYSTVRISLFTRLLAGLYLAPRKLTTPYGEGWLLRTRPDGVNQIQLPYGVMFCNTTFGGPPAHLAYMRAERLIVRAVADGQLQVRIDHQNDCLRLGTEAMESSRMRAQLTELARRLRTVVADIAPPAAGGREEKRTRLFEAARESLRTIHEAVAARKSEIEKRKEDFERMQQQQQRDEEERRKRAAEKRAIEEEARKKREAAAREERRLKKHREAEALKEAKRLMQQTGQDTSAIDGIDSRNVDVDKVRQEAREKADKAKQDAEKRMREAARRLDYLTRALREKERGLLAKQREAQIEEDRRHHAELHKEALSKELAAHEEALKHKARMARMLEFTKEFETAVAERHSVLLERRRQERARQRELERAAKLQRAFDRRAKHIEDERKRVEDEERMREELERREREEREAEEAEARRASELDRATREDADLRAQRREEEARAGGRRNEFPGRDDGDRDREERGGRFGGGMRRGGDDERGDERGPPRVGGGGGGGWRDREARGGDDRERGFGGAREEGGGRFGGPRGGDDREERGGRFGGGMRRGGDDERGDERGPPRFGGGGGGGGGGWRDREARGGDRGGDREREPRPEGRADGAARWGR